MQEESRVTNFNLTSEFSN